MSSCTSTLRVAVAIVAVALGTESMAQQQQNPVAKPEAVVTFENARFTVLTPAMIRMEWSAEARFEDRPSFVFINRNTDIPDFTSSVGDGQLTISTADLTLRFTPDGKPFSVNNLSVAVHVHKSPSGDETVVWKPGTPATGNLRGTTRTLDGISGSCPLEEGLLSRDGWSVVDDSQTLLFDKHPGTDIPWATVRPDPKAIDWYFFGYGHNYKQALADYTKVAGRIPLPPRYVFGTWWSRYWAYSDEELRTLVRDFDKHEVPLDVLVVDMDWHLDGWTGYTWNRKLFPDPDGFLKWVHDQGLKTTLNLHPHSGVGKHEEAFPQVAKAMGEDPETTDQVPFDCADPRYMDAYFKYLHRPMEKDGVDFWWIDWQQGEQTNIRGLDPLWWLNHLHWTDMQRNEERGDKRPLIFSRWGGLGNHRYQIGFSGDTYCNWASLAFQPYFTSTAGNVGFAYWSHDIGGHQPGPVDPELYARWIQYGVFSPVLRTHTTTNPKAERRIWKFPEEVFHAAREAFYLRYELIPYIYTAARKCYDTGLPICRPLYYEWPEHDEAYERSGQYMFGDDMMVAPITTPAGELSDCAEADIWLPPGEWFNWFSGKTYEGSQRILLQVAIDEIPLFVRSGAIIPTMRKMNRSDAHPVDPLVLHIFPAEKAHTDVYEDDGLSNGYEAGAFTRMPVTYRREGRRHGIAIGPVQGGFEGMESDRGYEIRLHNTFPIESVIVNGRPLEEIDNYGKAGWFYDSRDVATVIRLPEGQYPAGARVTVTSSASASAAESSLDGLRGTLGVLDEVAAMIGNQGPDKKYHPDSIRKQLASLSECENAVKLAGESKLQYIEAVADSTLSQRDKTMALSRLLGLICRLEAAPDNVSDGSLALSLDITISDDNEVLPKDGMTADLELEQPVNWKYSGTFRWATVGADGVERTSTISGDQPVHAPLSPAEPLTISTKIEPAYAAQTTIIKGTLTIQVGDLRLPIPISKTLFPSINRWWIAGPFDAQEQDRLDTVFGPEKSMKDPAVTELDTNAIYRDKDGQPVHWHRVERKTSSATRLDDEFFIEFYKVFGQRRHNSVAYALAYLYADEDTEATLAIGSDDGFVVWLNGKELRRNDVGRPYASKQDRLPLHLLRGNNELLIKISQGGGDWSFCAHVEDEIGNPLPQIQVHLKPRME